MSQLNDTIAAISTGLIQSAISIIRVSGPKSHQILYAIFRVQSANIIPRQLYVKWLIDPATNRHIDQCAFFCLKSPKSYTGEDMIEIHCHGGVAISRYIFELIIKEGARIADRGEFTKRAFLNNKIDLIQAEGIISLIRAKTKNAALCSSINMEGRFSVKIEEINRRLVNLLSRIEAAIDFPEDIEMIDSTEAGEGINECCAIVDKLLLSADFGIALSNGIRVAIVGKPNVGKSSIFNALVKRDRAIVTDIPGTTTDTIEEYISIKGIPFILIDTAGIREYSNDIEREGIIRTKRAIESADIAILIFDCGIEMDNDDTEIIDTLKAMKKNTIVVYNKIDMGYQFNHEISKNLGKIINTSAIKEEGIEELEERLFSSVHVVDNSINDGCISNLRQKNCAVRARHSLANAIESLNNEIPMDLIAIDLRESISSLNEMNGRNISDEVLDKIFSEFCVGK